MNSTENSGSRPGAWVRWILLVKGMILLLAVAGPGYNQSTQKEGDHALIAQWFMEDPDFLEAVIINFIVIHIFLFVYGQQPGSLHR